MNTNWLAASSFSRARELIAAINVVSIHAKLSLANVFDPTDQEELKKSRDKISNFLLEFESILKNAEQDEGVVLGSDPRLGQLAQIFMEEKKRLPNKSVLYIFSIRKLSDLVNSDDKADMQTLIDLLKEFRNILEQHSRSDYVGVLGDI